MFTPCLWKYMQMCKKSLLILRIVDSVRFNSFLDREIVKTVYIQTSKHGLSSKKLIDLLKITYTVYFYYGCDQVNLNAQI